MAINCADSRNDQASQNLSTVLIYRGSRWLPLLVSPHLLLSGDCTKYVVEGKSKLVVVTTHKGEVSVCLCEPVHFKVGY